jgi:hypothetical protein
VEKPDGNRTLELLRRRWEYNIKKGLYLECRAWTRFIWHSVWTSDALI